MNTAFRDWAPEERAGQHIMGGFDGTAAPPALLERIRSGRVGGVILFSRNIENAGQALELTLSLQRAAAGSRRRLPLLIGIDQEGGRVNRLSADFTRFPAAQVFGRIGDPGLAGRAARATAVELRAVGVNINMAPVLDLLTNPECSVIGDRSFGTDPARVAEMGVAVAEGLQAEGVAAVAKHFPGIGDLAPDPHVVLPQSDRGLNDLRARELRPFAEILRAPLPEGGVVGVMPTHALFSRMDPANPASLSPFFLRTLLRGELGFGGLVLTDDLEMGAIEDPAEAALASLQAEADIALICHEEEAQERACARIARALQEEELPPGREAESLGRIHSAKMRFAGPPAAFPENACLGELRAQMGEIVACAAHRKILGDIIARAENPLEE